MKNGEQENGCCVNISSDCKNRIDCTPHIYALLSILAIICEIPNIMIISGGQVNKHLCSAYLEATARYY